VVSVGAVIAFVVEKAAEEGGRGSVSEAAATA